VLPARPELLGNTSSCPPRPLREPRRAPVRVGPGSVSSNSCTWPSRSSSASAGLSSSGVCWRCLLTVRPSVVTSSIPCRVSQSADSSVAWSSSWYLRVQSISRPCHASFESGVIAQHWPRRASALPLPFDAEERATNRRVKKAVICPPFIPARLPRSPLFVKRDEGPPGGRDRKEGVE
jgi:hypothetical protein